MSLGQGQGRHSPGRGQGAHQWKVSTPNSTQEVIDLKQEKDKSNERV
jgi:hypothetical protein